MAIPPRSTAHGEMQEMGWSPGSIWGIRLPTSIAMATRLLMETGEFISRTLS